MNERRTGHAMEEEDEIKEFLEQHAKEIGRIVVDPLAVHMKGLGVTCLEDLRDIQRNNLVDTGKLIICAYNYTWLLRLRLEHIADTTLDILSIPLYTLDVTHYTLEERCQALLINLRLNVACLRVKGQGAW